jgi:multidrug efflux pump subunit AcrB
MGSPIYLRDVAKVTDGIDIQNFKRATVMFKKSRDEKMGPQKKQITLTVAKLAGTNAVFVAEDVLELLKEFEPELAKEGV